MNVLVVGRGGREHALAWKIAQSPQVSHVYVAPGNPGMESVATRVSISSSNHEALASFCAKHAIGLVVIGPETPLIDGLADKLRALNIVVFGPGAAGARLEGSKSFAKRLFQYHGIPSARYQVFTDYAEAEKAALAWNGPVVVKADGAAAGKGVFVCETSADAAEAVRTVGGGGSSSSAILLEERLSGPEASVFALCNENTMLPLQPAQDYKRAADGDTGPNTGGMGAISPVDFVTPELLEEAVQKVLLPTAYALLTEGIAYRGLLYAGLMYTEGGWKILEYNCRFGDPETQALLPRLASDVVPALLTIARGEPTPNNLVWNSDSCVCITLTAEGYPGPHARGHIVRGLKLAEEVPGVVVFHAGTSRNDQGLIVTDGGRVLNVVAQGPSFEAARTRAYEAAQCIEFTGKQLRSDIGRNRAGVGKAAAQ